MYKMEMLMVLQHTAECFKGPGERVLGFGEAYKSHVKVVFYSAVDISQTKCNWKENGS